jgi:hypothetical protein
MTQEVEKKVREYVLLHYRQTFTADSTMIIKEHDTHFTVSKNPTASPIILGKKILE